MYASTKVVLADSYIACAVPAGAPRPDLSTPDAVHAAFLNALSVAWSDCASGEYIQHELLARLGIEAQVKAKGRQIPATPVGEIVAQRQAAFGCQQSSELQQVKGIDIVSAIPGLALAGSSRADIVGVPLVRPSVSRTLGLISRKGHQLAAQPAELARLLIQSLRGSASILTKSKVTDSRRAGDLR